MENTAHYINIDSRLRQITDRITYLGATNITSISFTKGSRNIVIQVDDPALIQLESAVVINGPLLNPVILRTIDEDDHQIVYFDRNNLIIEVVNKLIPYCTPGSTVKVYVEGLEDNKWVNCNEHCASVGDNCIKLEVPVGSMNSIFTECNMSLLFKTVCGIDTCKLENTILHVTKINGKCITLSGPTKADSTFTLEPSSCLSLGVVDNVIFGYPSPSSYRILLPRVYNDVLSISLINTVFHDIRNDYVYMNINNLGNLESINSSRHFAKILPGCHVDNFVCNKVLYDDTISEFGEISVSFDRFDDDPADTVGEHSFVLEIITLAPINDKNNVLG